MQFVYPSFLFALSAIAIPILIHLFHFRRYKKVVFSDLRFLKQVQEQNKSKQKIKDLLVLLSRILAIIFLVLAFAQPYLPSDQSLALKGTKSVSIFIDNSFSMNTEGNEGNLLESAKNKARAIINAYGSDNQFQILTHNFEGRHQRLVNKADALTWIDEITISPATASLSEILQRQKQALEKAGTDTKITYVLSDFQQHMIDASMLPKDSGVIRTFIPITANKQHNISVDSIWLSSPIVQPNTPVTLTVRIRNYSDETIENVSVTLLLNNQQKGLQNYTCDANGYVDIPFTVTPSGSPRIQEGEVRIMDHPITFDDQLYFCFTAISSYNVLVINGDEPNTFIQKLFESDKTYTISQVNQNQLNYSAFGTQRLIILNEPQELTSGLAQELKKYVEEGGQLLIIPPSSEKMLPSLNAFLMDIQLPTFSSVSKQQIRVNTLNTQDALFKSVFQKIPQNMDLPLVNQHYSLQRNNTTIGRMLMELANGAPFVWKGAYKKGNIVLYTTPLQINWSTFPQHAIFVPLMLKLATGKQQTPSLYTVIGKPQWISLDQEAATAKLISLKGKGTELTFQTSQRNGKTSFYLDQPLTKAGLYSIIPEGSTTVTQVSALNFNRKESDMRTLQTAELQSLVGSLPGARLTDYDTDVLQNTLSNELNGTPFWRYCVWLTLLFVLIEILLLRILK